MASANSSSPRISLDELIALNDEIAALVKAGVPIERGLFEVSRDLPGRLGRIAESLAGRLSRGETLAAAVSGERSAMPKLYGAIVEAGLRSGRLAAALEGLADSARRLADLRRVAGLSLLYPAIVALLAYVLFVFLAVRIAPTMAATVDQLNLVGIRFAAGAASFAAQLGRWWPAVPAAIALAAAAWWWQSGRARLIQPQFATGWLGWIPWLGGVVRNTQIATFCDLMALLIEQDVPLPQSLVLAADATGNRRLIRFAGEVAGGLERGESLATATGDPAARGAAPTGGRQRDYGFPPLLRWLLAAGSRRGTLVPALRHSAETYRQRAIHRAELARLLLPILVTVVIGGTSALVYALMLFVPWAALLREVARP